MQKTNFLSVVALTFSSVCELLLTRIIPLFVLLIVSLLLKFFHLLRSLAAGSSKPIFFSHSEDLKWENLLDAAPRDDDGRVENEDDSDIEETVPLQSDSDKPRFSTFSGSASRQGRGFRNETVSRNLSQTDSADTEPTFPLELPAPVDDAEPIDPSDVPTLQNPGARLRSVRNRKLPPTLSLVKKTLKENSRKDEESQAYLEVPVKKRISNPSAGSKSEAKTIESKHFSARFRSHFLLDR